MILRGCFSYRKCGFPCQYQPPKLRGYHHHSLCLDWRLQPCHVVEILLLLQSHSISRMVWIYCHGKKASISLNKKFHDGASRPSSFMKVESLRRRLLCNPWRIFFGEELYPRCRRLNSSFSPIRLSANCSEGKPNDWQFCPIEGITEPRLTHTPRWTARAMGYERFWANT